MKCLLLLYRQILRLVSMKQKLAEPGCLQYLLLKGGKNHL